MMYMLVPQIEKFSYLKYFIGGLTTQKIKLNEKFSILDKIVCKFSHACVIEHHEAIHCRHFPYLVISQVGIALGQKDGYTSPTRLHIVGSCLNQWLNNNLAGEYLHRQ